jgi:hypothetical protein
MALERNREPAAQVGVKPVSGHELVHSVEELKMLVEQSTGGGVMMEEERDASRHLRPGRPGRAPGDDPRTEMIAVEADTPWKRSSPW